jgi:hypothetical protein
MFHLSPFEATETMNVAEGFVFILHELPSGSGVHQVSGCPHQPPAEPWIPRSGYQKCL